MRKILLAVLLPFISLLAWGQALAGSDGEGLGTPIVYKEKLFWSPSTQKPAQTYSIKVIRLTLPATSISNPYRPGAVARPRSKESMKALTKPDFLVGFQVTGKLEGAGQEILKTGEYYQARMPEEVTGNLREGSQARIGVFLLNEENDPKNGLYIVSWRRG